MFRGSNITFKLFFFVVVVVVVVVFVFVFFSKISYAVCVLSQYNYIHQSMFIQFSTCYFCIISVFVHSSSFLSLFFPLNKVSFRCHQMSGSSPWDKCAAGQCLSFILTLVSKFVNDSFS